MPRFFNTAGPCRAELHYLLPPERRIAEVPRLIEESSYFVVHAPRQVGKTTSLLALAKRLTAEGRYAAILLSLEAGAPLSGDLGAAESAILAGWQRTARYDLPPELRPPACPEAPPGQRLATALETWAASCPRPLVVFLDEIDALSDLALLSTLRQLREGHRYRPRGFPHALALVGMRDVRDYKVRSGGSEELNTSSPFNIKTASLTLRGFSAEEIGELYAQHTEETGQPFTSEALARAFELTQGQPWLVNALAAECVRHLAPDPAMAITRQHVDSAKERLIARQDTHLDSLGERLREERVRRVLEPILAGTSMDALPPDDLRFVMDLGLVRASATGGVQVANPIYAEVIPTALATIPRASLPHLEPVWLRTDGSLDESALLRAFVAFWRQHGEPLMGSAPYHEIAPHLVLMAFLHRVINGGGSLEREYAVGSGRMDLCVRWRTQVLAIELKVWREGRADPKTEGLGQLDAYLAGLGLDHGWLVIFDRRHGQPPLADRTSSEEAVSPAGRRVIVVRA